MSGSTPSTPSSQPATEPPANLSQNLDEALDLELALASLGGLRHSASCEASERSQRRYDERNHRLHEARMGKLGLEGDEPKADDMSQQVLIRSPIIHNHYPATGQPVAPQPAATGTPPSQPVPATQPTPSSGAAPNKRILPYVLTALLGTGLGAGAGALPWVLSDRDVPPAAADTDTQYELQPMRISGNGDDPQTPRP